MCDYFTVSYCVVVKKTCLPYSYAHLTIQSLFIIRNIIMQCPTEYSICGTMMYPRHRRVQAHQCAPSWSHTCRSQSMNKHNSITAHKDRNLTAKRVRRSRLGEGMSSSSYALRSQEHVVSYEQRHRRTMIRSDHQQSLEPPWHPPDSR